MSITKKPSWTTLKAILLNKDQAELLALIKDLYSLNKNNKTFIETRYLSAQDSDKLEPYKKIISAALYPDVYKNKSIQLTKGRKAISDYKKATNDLPGTLELMVLYVKSGTDFSLEFGEIDHSFYNSLSSMFESIVKLLAKEDQALQQLFLPKLFQIVKSAKPFGWGYYDEISDLLHDYFPDYTGH